MKLGSGVVAGSPGLDNSPALPARVLHLRQTPAAPENPDQVDFSQMDFGQEGEVSWALSPPDFLCLAFMQWMTHHHPFAALVPEIPPTPDVFAQARHPVTPTLRRMELSPISSVRSTLFHLTPTPIHPSQDSCLDDIGTRVQHAEELKELSETENAVSEGQDEMKDSQQQQHQQQQLEEEQPQSVQEEEETENSRRLEYVDLPASQISSQEDIPLLTASQHDFIQASVESDDDESEIPLFTQEIASPSADLQQLSDNSLNKICSQFHPIEGVGVNLRLSPTPPPLPRSGD